MTRSTGWRLRQEAVIILVAVPLLVLAGCSGMEDPSVARAKTVYQQTIELDRQYAAYAASIASTNSSPFVEQLLLERAGSSHYPTALEAVKALQDDPPAEAAAVLDQVYQEKSGALKLQAAVALARLGNEPALAWLKEQVVAGQALVNIPVVLLLAEKEETELLRPHLETLMQSESLASRNEAYAILGTIARPWATGLLIHGLENEHGEDRQTAIAALGSSGDPEAAQWITRFIGTQGLVFVTLEALGDMGNPNSIPVLEGILQHDEDTVRVYAAIALWKLGREEPAVAVLEPLLAADDPVVRRLLAEQLGALSGEKVVDWLGMLASDEDREVRLHAMRALVFVATPGEEARLVTAAADQDFEVSAAAINGLARVGGPEAMGELASLLESQNPYLALSAANAILAIDARQLQPAE
jgi:HEAT repeat protein